MTVAIGSAAQLAIATQPIGAASGAPLATQPVVDVEDSGGNIVSGSSAAVTVSASAGGALDGVLTVHAVNGVATFSGVTFSVLSPPTTR